MCQPYSEQKQNPLMNLETLSFSPFTTGFEERRKEEKSPCCEPLLRIHHPSPGCQQRWAEGRQLPAHSPGQAPGGGQRRILTIFFINDTVLLAALWTAELGNQIAWPLSSWSDFRSLLSPYIPLTWATGRRLQRPHPHPPPPPGCSGLLLVPPNAENDSSVGSSH